MSIRNPYDYFQIIEAEHEAIIWLIGVYGCFSEEVLG
jgi:hypothetical protein